MPMGLHRLWGHIGAQVWEVWMVACHGMWNLSICCGSLTVRSGNQEMMYKA